MAHLGPLRVDRRFPLVPFSDPDQIIGIANIKFEEHPGMHEWLESGTKKAGGIYSSP